jgi:hypothetical protein
VYISPWTNPKVPVFRFHDLGPVAIGFEMFFFSDILVVTRKRQNWTVKRPVLPSDLP